MIYNNYRGFSCKGGIEMKEKLTIDIINDYLRKEGLLDDNEELNGFFIQFNENKEPEEILINKAVYPTEYELEQMWRFVDSTYDKPDKLSKEKFYEYQREYRMELVLGGEIPPEASAYLLGNYDVSHLVDNPMHSSLAQAEISRSIWE